MKNGQLEYDYNVQIDVESNHIMILDVSSNKSDVTKLIPYILDNIKNNYNKEFKNIVCDYRYESEENYKYLKENNLNSYIKPLNYKQIKKKICTFYYIKINLKGNSMMIQIVALGQYSKENSYIKLINI
ncbi:MULTISPECIES: hypothetical protein [unclassified Clostridioides]|uniref:hypothetical protein n=1 Tax=unclassified Clostridioides TaxID=2635829 RepID=UPI001D126D9E|nr:hypothetical protein [Clostridioides sp. ES-S-0171-01]MCC0689237.1 hypothetical protein [Clostridioides sp. ES-S-0056-01]MCC0715455.1 hypothetical protein [Clostridioides sp. ES-S-0077-01]UDN55996.1 hypothetical protein JJC02_07450 [Clostridioides sp. ES-S-0054-01]